jgi:soluble P-type ATPase
MRRAARTDANQAQIVKALRGYGCKVFPTHMVGNGFPDLVVSIHGKVGFMEIKDGNKSESRRALTADQIKFWTEWKDCPLSLVTDVDGALRFARMLAFETLP